MNLKNVERNGKREKEKKNRKKSILRMKAGNGICVNGGRLGGESADSDHDLDPCWGGGGGRGRRGGRGGAGGCGGARAIEQTSVRPPVHKINLSASFSWSVTASLKQSED